MSEESSEHDFEIYLEIERIKDIKGREEKK